MSEVVWSEVLRLARRAKQVFVAGFGEPLTNPRCLELLQQLNDEGIRTSFGTNGLALNPVTARRLADLPFLVHINVSIDSPDAASYRHIRGGNLARALNGLANLVDAMPDTSRITVSSVAMRENVGTLAEFPPILAGLGITTYIVQGLNDYTAFSKTQSLLAAHDLRADLSRLRSACDQWGVQLQLTTPERTTAEEHHLEAVLAQYYSHREGAAPQTRQCKIPWEVPYIDKDGRVFPCCIAGASSRSQLGQIGDLHHRTLSEIWTGDAYQEFRRALLEADTTPEVCQSCTIVPAGPHPFRAYSAELAGPIRVVTGDGAVCVRYRNTGTQTWAPDGVQVATTSPRDRRSGAAHRTWLTNARACSFAERIVAPGETATFTFRVTVPPRRTVEEFQLVAEGVTWLPNTRFSVVTPTAVRHPVRTAHWLAGRTRLALRR